MPPEAIADFRQQVREASTQFDAELTRKLTAAVDYVQNVTNRQLLRATAEYTADCFPDCQLYLAPSPSVSVTSVEYFDNENVLQTWDPSLYEFIPGEPGLLRPVRGEGWPSVGRGIRVVYEVGFQDWVTADPHVKEPIMMYGEYLYRGTDWGDGLTSALDNAQVGDEFTPDPQPTHYMSGYWW